LTATTTLSLLGTLSGSLLELGGIGVNCVEFGTANGETNSVAVLLSKTNVTVCGSATAEGLSHVTLWPALTCICRGTNTANMSVEFPPPACTLIDDVVVVVLLLLLLVSCAFMTLKLVVVISSVIDNADMTTTTANMDFIVIGAGNLIA
jgi:hypothetical protein